MKSTKVVFFIAVCAALLVGGCVKEADEPEYSLGAGDPVPVFSVELNDNSTWSSADMNGRCAVLVFFNTECGDCRRELPQVQMAYEECMRLGLTVDFVCIAREQTAGPVAAWWESEGLTLPYSPQPDRRVYNLFASVGIPRIYVVDPSGTITAAYTPETAPTARELTDVLAAIKSF